MIAANESGYAKLTDWTSRCARTPTTRMYFRSSQYEHHEMSTVAPHWRVRTGIHAGR